MELNVIRKMKEFDNYPALIAVMDESNLDSTLNSI